jgi:hypothetical protein
MASPLPISARDTIEFRPRTAAVITARQVLEEAGEANGIREIKRIMKAKKDGTHRQPDANLSVPK